MNNALIIKARNQIADAMIDAEGYTFTPIMFMENNDVWSRDWDTHEWYKESK